MKQYIAYQLKMGHKATYVNNMIKIPWAFLSMRTENFIPKRRKAMIMRIKQGQTAPFALRILSAKGAETEAVFYKDCVIWLNVPLFENKKKCAIFRQPLFFVLVLSYIKMYISLYGGGKVQK